MDEVLDHLRDALADLRDAQAKAQLGTQLMIGELITDVENLIERCENITQSDDNRDTGPGHQE